MAKDESGVLYLDQNKWIELARCVADPGSYADVYDVLEFLVARVREKRLLLPLTFSNIYETIKVNDPDRRSHLAWVQATLSQGWVFRSRSVLLRQQVAEYLCEICAAPYPTRKADWYLSKLFFEAAAEYDPSVFGIVIPEDVLLRMQQNASHAVFGYMTKTPESVRLDAVRRLSCSSRNLIEQFQKRHKLV